MKKMTFLISILLMSSVLFIQKISFAQQYSHRATLESGPKLAAAQQEDTLDAPAKTSRPKFAIHGGGFVPVGEFQDTVNDTFGFSAGGRYFLDEKEFLALYAGFGGANYASEQQKFLGFVWTTDTTMFFFEVGPQIHFGSGPVLPYIYGGGGFTNFSTTTTLTFDDEELDSETHASDWNLALFGGAGCQIRVSKGVYLDLSVIYQRNGTMTRLIDDEETTSEANIVRFQAGVSF